MAGARLAAGLATDLAGDFLADLAGALTLISLMGADFADLVAVLAGALPVALTAVLGEEVADLAAAFLADGRPGIWALTGSGSTRRGALPA